MSDKCPKCNLPEVRHEYTRGGALYRVWACESNEFKRSLACETITALRTELAEAQDKAMRFKDYTHERMDKLGAPHEVPESENTQAGCRIGGRFDWVERRVADGSHELIKPELKLIGKDV